MAGPLITRCQKGAGNAAEKQLQVGKMGGNGSYFETYFSDVLRKNWGNILLDTQKPFFVGLGGRGC